MRSFLTLIEIARILGRSLPDTRKVLSRSRLDGRMIAGERHWVRDEVLHWLEQEFDSLTVERLRDMDLAGEASTGLPGRACFVSELLTPETVHPWVNANTSSSLLRRLSELAVGTGRTWDRRAFREELQRREDAGSTAMANMIAFPHPRDVRRLYLEDDILLLARTHHGIPFGAERGRLTSLFFLLAFRRPDTHLHVLARLNRLLRKDEFVKGLLDAADRVDMLELIEARECEVVEDNG